MLKIHYKQIDLTQKHLEKIYLQKLQQKEFFIIGIEVFDNEISQFCHLNIDPQHNNSKNDSSITALEMVFKLKSDLKEAAYGFNNILLLTIKCDLDSISAISLVTMVLKSKFEINGDLILRLKAISLSDRHGMANEWKPNIRYDHFNLVSYTKYGIPVSLITIIGDINLNINYKIKTMTDYLLYGEFKDSEKYNQKAITKLSYIKSSTSHKVIIPEKLIFVESTYRGAIGFGYKKAPIVIAKNPKYAFGKKNNRIYGNKYTIAQYKENYIELDKIKDRVNKLEPGWGGSFVIIGSPQTNPSIIKQDDLIDLVKEYVNAESGI